MKTRTHLLAGALAIVAASAFTKPAHAQARQHYDLSEQDLGTALKAFASISGREVVAASDVVARKRSAAIRGDFAPAQAIALLLLRTGLRAEMVDGAFVIRPTGGIETANGPPADDIVITGSRIGGAKSSSPVVVIDREAMKSAGRTTVDDIIRTIPENFSGGQNPGVGYNVPETSGSNLGGSSSVNLRGLGSDATLTLLDGHRLSYSAALQSIDISAIPVGAIDRIEVVADGASSLYGSDAVAGVVNVILRRDFTGLETSAKLGGSTDGGNFTQQYAATLGARWRSGQMLLAYEFDRNTAISSSDRDDIGALRPGLTLLPPMRQHNVALVARQALFSGLTLSVDGLFGRRWTDNHFPLNPAGDLSVNGAYLSSSGQSFTIAPSLDLALTSGWSLSLSGSYGASRTTYGGYYLFGSTRIDAGGGYYRNHGSSAELSGTGDLFALPEGTAKAALGVGWRRNDFLRYTGSAASQIAHRQDSYYAFGELSLPVVNRLSASAALRYERYPGIGSVVTPKLGAIFSPTDDVDLKGSWGQSFRAPTLYQQYQPSFAYLIDAASVGSSAPAGATALLLLGGNPDLKPERSSNWSATIDFHPRGSGLDITASYFSVDYRNRTVTPILLLGTAVTDPDLAQFVTLQPSPAAQTAFISAAGSFTNTTGAAYDPSKVVAIVRNASVNAGRLRVKGVDLAVTYTVPLGAGAFRSSLGLSYIDSDRQLSAGQAFSQLSGIIFNSPHLKGRAEIGYTAGGLSLTGDINYIGPVRDTRAAVPSRVAGMTPIDLTFRYRTAEGGLLGGFDFVLSAQNVFNEKPAIIATSVFYDTPYDSTNYSVLGRVVSFSVSKKW